MEFDYIAIWIADEKELTAIWQIHCFGDRHVEIGQLFLHGLPIGDLQRHMGVAGVFFGHIHQNIVFGRVAGGIQNEIDVDTRGVLHHGDGLGADRPH